jgi:hypothetical protein
VVLSQFLREILLRKMVCRERGGRGEHHPCTGFVGVCVGVMCCAVLVPFSAACACDLNLDVS